MKRPAFQFYPGDWQRNANLRRCTPAARGVWVDIMCLMHDSDEYGLLRWPLKEIAQAVGAQMAHMRELVDKAVLKGHDKAVDAPLVYIPRSGRKDGDPVELIAVQPGPLWYSSRMVKDEYVRTIRGESTRFESESKPAPKKAPKPPPMASPKPPFGDGSSSASASATAVNTDYRQYLRDDDTPADWEQWRQFFESECGLSHDPYDERDRLKLRPIATHWVKAGITAGQMRKAIEHARATASEPIAYLPAYVDRVLTTQSAPPRQAAQARPPSPAELRLYQSSPQLMDPITLARVQAHLGIQPQAQHRPETIDMEAPHAHPLSLG